MSNIFHELKRGFLILGFTGPLSSGCTSAARFFENDISGYIQKRCDKGLSKLAYDIKRKFNTFKNFKDALGDNENKADIHSQINKSSYQIKEMLHLRETLTVLNDYKESNFKYISMTDMLLKLTLQCLWNAPEDPLNESLLKLKRAINYDPKKFAKVEEINNKIKNREISEIGRAHV